MTTSTPSGITLVINGQTPSQKNSKNILVNRKTGRPFISSNERVKSWQASAKLELTAQNWRVTGRVKAYYHFYVKDNVRRDLDNMIASVNDALQAAGVVEDDCWQVLSIGGAHAEIDRDDPRAVITLIDDSDTD